MNTPDSAATAPDRPASASGFDVRRYLLPVLEVIVLAALFALFIHEGTREPTDRQRLAMTGLAPTAAGPAPAAQPAAAERDLALLSTEDMAAPVAAD